jgi:Domain of unknown function (DUF4082)
LSFANLGRVANQDVDMLMIADEVVWSASTADGPYYLNDAASITPSSFSDGTPNIVTGHLTFFHNAGYVTGVQWYDLASGAGDWVLSLYPVTTSNGNVPNTGATKLASKTVASTGAGFRTTNFDTPVAVTTAQMYLVCRYSATGFYVHTSSFSGSHGNYTDADPVYIPEDNEDDSSIISGWSSCDRSLLKIGSGDVVPNVNGSGPFYGISPVFYKSL